LRSLAIEESLLSPSSVPTSCDGRWVSNGIGEQGPKAIENTLAVAGSRSEGIFSTVIGAGALIFRRSDVVQLKRSLNAVCTQLRMMGLSAMNRMMLLDHLKKVTDDVAADAEMAELEPMNATRSKRLKNFETLYIMSLADLDRILHELDTIKQTIRALSIHVHRLRIPQDTHDCAAIGAGDAERSHQARKDEEKVEDRERINGKHTPGRRKSKPLHT
jgi:hypothetical protein